MKSLSLLCLTLFFSFISHSQIPQDGLIGFFQLNGNAEDDSDFSNDGNITLNVDAAEDRFGNEEGALSFDGGAVELGVNDDFAVTNEVTVCAWVKAEEINIWGTVLSRWQNFDIGGYYLGINPGNNRMRFNVLLDDPVESSIIALDTWNHFVGVYDGTSAKMYQNGVLISSYDQVLEIGDSDTDMLIGNQTNLSGPFLGVLDDIIIYNRGLSEDEVLQVYNNVPSSIFDTEFDDFVIYPNPTTDRIFFNLDFGSQDQFELTNTSGQTVLQGTLQNQSLDVSNISAGIYLLNMTLEGQVVSRKIVIR